MTGTCSGVTVVQNELCFFVAETSSKNAIYATMIQSVIENKIVSFLVLNSSMLIARSRSGELQSLNIHKDISILGV
jgi:hypothetical protein